MVAPRFITGADIYAINAQDYFVAGDSGFDAAINRAIVAANGRGGGQVVVPNLGVVYSLSGKVVLLPNVYLVGHGAPLLKLANGANCSIIEGQNFLSLTGTNSASGVSNCGVANLVLDGNVTNNGSPGTNQGHGIALYGRDLYIEDIEISNVAARGLHTEYGNGAVGVSPFNGHVRALLCNTTGKEGWWNQLSDLHANDINIRAAGQLADNTYDAIYLGASGSIRGSNINVWSSGANYPRYCLHVDSPRGTTISGAHLETGKTASVRINADRVQMDAIYSYNQLGSSHIVLKGNGCNLSVTCEPATIGLTTAVPLVLGESGDSPLGNLVNLVVANFTGSVIDSTNSGGNNVVFVTGYQSSGALFAGGSGNINDRVVACPAGGAISATEGARFAGAVAIGPGCSAAVASAAIGNQTTVSAQNAAAIGNACTGQAIASFASGSRSVSRLYGSRVHAQGRLTNNGDRQNVEAWYVGATTDATPTELFLDGAAIHAVVQNTSSWAFQVDVHGHQNGGAGSVMHRSIRGVIKRGANAAATALAGTNVVSDINVPAGWDATATADTSNGSLKLTVTGAAATNITWEARLRFTEIVA